MNIVMSLQSDCINKVNHLYLPAFIMFLTSVELQLSGLHNPTDISHLKHAMGQ